MRSLVSWKNLDVRRLAAGALGSALLLVPASPPGADSGVEGPGRRPAPPVPLERLFELPSGFEAQPSKTLRGASSIEWRERFLAAQADVERSAVALQRSKQELSELAQDSNTWTMAPPIGGGAQAAATDAPLSYELRQRIKRQEAEVDAAKARLLNLEVEANLAGVPESWRHALGETP